MHQARRRTPLVRERGPAPSHGRPRNLRQGATLAPWVLRSRRNRILKELGLHPGSPAIPWVTAAALGWVAAVSAACGALVASLGDPGRSWAMAAMALLVVPVPWSVGGVSRTKALDLGLSGYARHQAARSRSAMPVIVADVLVRAGVALAVLIVLSPGAVLLLVSAYGPLRGALLLPGVVCVLTAVCLIILAGSLLRIALGIRFVAVAGYGVEIVLRGTVAALATGVATYAIGSFVIRSRTADWTHLSVPDIPLVPLVAGLAGSAVLTAVIATAAHRLLESRRLDRSMARLPSVILHGARRSEVAAVPAWSGDDVITAKEKSLVRRSRLRAQGGVDGLIAAACALIGAVVGASSSGMVTSSTARAVALLFALALVVEFVSDGLRRVNSADTDGLAATWILTSRLHYQRMIAYRARRHARALAGVVAAVGLVCVIVMPMSWVFAVCIGTTGALTIFFGTVAVVGFSASYPRWDWSSTEEIGMHPSAQGFRHALTGLVWMTTFVLASIGARVGQPALDGDTVAHRLVSFAIIAVLAIGAALLAPRGCTAVMEGRSR